MKYRRIAGGVVVVAALVACGRAAPPGAGSAPSSTRAVPDATQRVPLPAPAPSGHLSGVVFSGVKMLGQRDIESISEDDPAAYYYRLHYSLDSLRSAEKVDPHDDPGLVRTQITTSATVAVTNMTPHRKAPLNDLSGVLLAGAYLLPRGICQQRRALVSGRRGDYCFVSLWSSPDQPGELAAGETRRLDGGSPVSWEIGPLTKKERDAVVADLLSPDLYVVASLSSGYYFVPKNHCTFTFDLTSGHAIIDTQPHVIVCGE